MKKYRSKIIILLVVTALFFQLPVFANTDSELDKTGIEAEQIIEPRGMAQSLLVEIKYVYQGSDIVRMNLVDTQYVYQEFFPPTGYHYEQSGSQFHPGDPYFAWAYWERIDRITYSYVLVRD